MPAPELPLAKRKLVTYGRHLPCQGVVIYEETLFLASDSVQYSPIVQFLSGLHSDNLLLLFADFPSLLNLPTVVGNTRAHNDQHCTPRLIGPPRHRRFSIAHRQPLVCLCTTAPERRVCQSLHYHGRKSPQQPLAGVQLSERRRCHIRVQLHLVSLRLYPLSH